MNVAVFLSASEEVSPMFLAESEALGEALARDGHAVVYGGSKTGCMGALARGVKVAGGRLIGVVPEMDFHLHLVQPGLDEEHVVPSLSARKTKMNALADAFVVYPGGLGTLDEVLEVLALKSLGTLDKPVVFLNLLGVWAPFVECLGLLREQRLIRQPLNHLFHVLDNVESLRDHLLHAL